MMIDVIATIIISALKHGNLEIVIHDAVHVTTSALDEWIVFLFLSHVNISNIKVFEL